MRYYPSTCNHNQQHYKVTQIYGISIPCILMYFSEVMHQTGTKIPSPSEAKSRCKSCDFPLAHPLWLSHIWNALDQKHAPSSVHPPREVPKRTPSSALSVQAKGSAMLRTESDLWSPNGPNNHPTKKDAEYCFRIIPR